MIGLRLSKLSAREKIGTAAGLLLLLAMLGDQLLVRPMFRKFRDLDGAIEREQSSLGQNLSILRGRDVVVAEYGQVRSLLGSVSSPAKAIDELKSRIDELARETGVTVVSMDDREPRLADYHEEFYVEIGRFEADMPSLLRFLARLEAAPGMLRVDKLAVKPIEGRDAYSGSVVITQVLLLAEA